MDLVTSYCFSVEEIRTKEALEDLSNSLVDEILPVLNSLESCLFYAFKVFVQERRYSDDHFRVIISIRHSWEEIEMEYDNHPNIVANEIGMSVFKKLHGILR